MRERVFDSVQKLLWILFELCLTSRGAEVVGFTFVFGLELRLFLVNFHITYRIYRHI